jgi:protein-S-isoprenylcysteine O-methyltransferase Ste14
VKTIAVAIGVIWLAFWIYWLAAASGVKPASARWGRFVGARVVLIAAVVFLARDHTFRMQPGRSETWLAVFGLVVFLAGIALAVWARVHLASNWGTPMSEKVNPELVTSGPYSRIRHPIYSGLILAMIGSAVALSWYWLILAGLLAAWFIYSAITEERYMTRLFPDAYPAYKRSTKMMVPFVL